VVFKNKIKIISIRNSVTISILLNWNKLKRKLQYQNQCTWMTSFSSVQYTSSGTPRAFPQVKKQVHLRKDARSSDVLHFVCFREEAWNCMHFLVILSLKTLWAGANRWRTALHRFYVYRYTYFISRDSKMCTFEVLFFVCMMSGQLISDFVR
jgi:hypothetical protein